MSDKLKEELELLRCDFGAYHESAKKRITDLEAQLALEREARKQAEAERDRMREALDDAIGLLDNASQQNDPGWIKDNEKLHAEYEALTAPPAPEERETPPDAVPEERKTRMMTPPEKMAEDADAGWPHFGIHKWMPECDAYPPCLPIEVKDEDDGK